VTAATIARVTLRRLARDRTSLFFMIILPVVVIVVVGASVGGFSRFKVAVVNEDSGRLGAGIVSALRHSTAIDLHVFSTADAARTSVRRAETTLAVIIPRTTSADLQSGHPGKVVVLGDRTSSSFEGAFTAVSAAVSNQSARLQAAGFAAQQVGGTVDDHLGEADRAAASTAALQVTTSTIDTVRQVLPEGFSYSAPTMLVLFVFINALAAGAGIIETRQLRIYERMSAAPVRRRTIIAGETLAYLSISLLQSVLIVTIGATLFGVSWGDPIAAAALIMVWALVGTGAGVLSGTLFRTPEQASSIGPALGIGLGMLGGCMWPLEIVSPLMRTVGHITPQSWAVDAWTILLSRKGNLVDLAPQLGVLALFAAALISLATYRLGRRLT